VPWNFPAIFALGGRTEVLGHWYRPGPTFAAAFVWREGAITYLPTLPDPGPPTWASVAAVAIDSRGLIAGTSTTAGAQERHPVLWRRDEIVDLGTLPGATSCDVVGTTGLNEAGYVIGYCRSADGNTNRAFVWRRGTMTDVGDLGGERMWASEAGERGHVIGVGWRADDRLHAWVWRRGVLVDLGGVGPHQTRPTGVDDRGRVVGNAFDDAFGTPHAMLWVPAGR
jgi:probable HAF family extracellular repeat protein